MRKRDARGDTAGDSNGHRFDELGRRLDQLRSMADTVGGLASGAVSESIERSGHQLLDELTHEISTDAWAVAEMPATEFEHLLIKAQFLEEHLHDAEGDIVQGLAASLCRDLHALMARMPVTEPKKADRGSR